MKPESPIYIAGPMTGIDGYNYRAFNAMAENLRMEGYEVINPAETDNGSTDQGRPYYFRRAVQQLSQCNSVVLLDGWGQSLGALTEVLIAWQLGMKFYRYSIGEEMTLPVEVAEVMASAIKCVGGSMTANRVKHSVRSWEKEPGLRHTMAAAVHSLKAGLALVTDEHEKRLLYAALDMTQSARVHAGFKTDESIRQEDNDDHAQNAVCRAAMLKIQEGKEHA